MKNLVAILGAGLLFTGCLTSDDSSTPPVESTADCVIVDGVTFCKENTSSSEEEEPGDNVYSSDLIGYSSSEEDLPIDYSSIELGEECIVLGGAEYCKDVEIDPSSSSVVIYESSSSWECDYCSSSDYEYNVDSMYTSNDTLYHEGTCQSDELYSWENIVNTPIYLAYEEYLKSIGNESGIKLETTGKIYQVEKWKFINEVDKGVHVYDNSDPVNPKYISFINIPGNRDIAIKNNTLLADSYATLVALDFSSPGAVKLLKNIPDVLTGRYENGYEMLTKDSGLIVDWDIDTTVNVMCQNYREWDYDMMPVLEMTDDAAESSSEMSNDVEKSVVIGQGGSLARFALSAEYLYAVTDRELITFWVTDESNPKYSSTTDIDWSGIETIYMKEDMLFVGSMNAMYIYDISNPSNPKMASRFSHVTSCDPVVVEGDYAYVTLRTGTGCRWGDTELEVIDVSDIYEPKLLETYEMDNPSGLGIHDDALYVCDGRAGLKVFDITNTPELEMVNIVDTIEVNDLIVDETNLTLVGPKGMYQYDHSDPTDLVFQSFIEAK
ncbi:MAG: hypothetical protein OCC49_05250 [Fibrobacterales bacterium]